MEVEKKIHSLKSQTLRLDITEDILYLTQGQSQENK